MTNPTTRGVLSLTLLFSATGVGQQARGTNAVAPRVSLCELLTHSKQYVAQTVSVRVRIHSYKARNGDLGLEFRYGKKARNADRSVSNSG